MDWTPDEIAVLRSILRLSVDEFAGRTGVAEKSVRNWESGKHRPQSPSKRQLDDLYERLSPRQRDQFLTRVKGTVFTQTVSRPARSLATVITPAIPVALGEEQAIMGTATTLLPDHAASADFDELAQALLHRIERARPGMTRREALSRLTAALALAAVGPTLELRDPDERQRVAQVLREPHRVDDATLRHSADILLACRRQGDVLGPEVALQTALAQRQLMAAILTDVPERLRPHALSLYAEWSQLAGWSTFNLGNYSGAQRYYDEARVIAHEAENTELVTYVLCAMSHLATWQGMPRVGIDHAVAAAMWASSPRAHAYAADVAVRAFAAAGQESKGREAIGREHAALGAPGSGPPAPWWYFYDESFYWQTRAEFALQVGETVEAHKAIDTSLTLIDSTNLHNFAFGLLMRAEAHIQDVDVDRATGVLGDVVTMTSAKSSERLDQRVRQLRKALDPWSPTEPVRELDERITHYRDWSTGSESTNSR